MFIPEGYTEETTLQAIKQVVDALAQKFVFGYQEVQDIKSQGTLFAIEALPRFDITKNHTLDNFLYIHVRNRLTNYKRDNYFRSGSPCLQCPFYDPNNKKSVAKNQCSEFEDKEQCKKYALWAKRKQSKENLAHPGLESTPAPSKNNVGRDVEHSELQRKINDELPLDLRSDYLRMIQGISIPKQAKDRVRRAVAQIIPDLAEEYGFDLYD